LWAGFSPTAWRSGNLSFHVVNTLLVYWLCRDLRFGQVGAFVGALIFGLHGSRPEVVTWVAARFDLMAVMFGLACILATLHGAKWWIGSCFVALALMSKESAYMVPALAAIVLHYLGFRWSEAWRRVAPLLAIAIAALAYRLLLLHGIGGYHDVESGVPTVFQFGPTATLNAMLSRFWAAMLFPLNWTGGLARVTAIALAAALAALAYLARRGAEQRKTLLGIVFAAACSLPVHQFLSIGPDLEKSRVLYFASVGLAILFAGMFEQVDWKMLVCAAAILGFQWSALQNNLMHWKQVGELAERTCASQAKLGRTVALGLPNVVDGVYFLHMGFPECVKFIDPAAEASTIAKEGARVTTWDPETRTLR
jgi:hypothetical protein